MSLIKKIKQSILYPKKIRKLDDVSGHLGLNEGYQLHKIASLLDSDAVIVEIGALKGKSTCFIAEGIGSKGCQFFTIDPWDYDPEREGKVNIFESFLENTRFYADKIKPLRGFSYDVVKSWPKTRRIDFLWIDGDHSYEGVKKDIEDWLPLVKENGYIAFHDYRDAPGVKKAVDELSESNRVKFIRTVGCTYISKACNDEVDIDYAYRH